MSGMPSVFAAGPSKSVAVAQQREERLAEVAGQATEFASLLCAGDDALDDERLRRRTTEVDVEDALLAATPDGDLAVTPCAPNHDAPMMSAAGLGLALPWLDAALQWRESAGAAGSGVSRERDSLNEALSLTLPGRSPSPSPSSASSAVAAAASEAMVAQSAEVSSVARVNLPVAETSADAATLRLATASRAPSPAVAAPRSESVSPSRPLTLAAESHRLSEVPTSETESAVLPIAAESEGAPGMPSAASAAPKKVTLQDSAPPALEATVRSARPTDSADGGAAVARLPSAERAEPAKQEMLTTGLAALRHESQAWSPSPVSHLATNASASTALAAVSDALNPQHADFADKLATQMQWMGQQKLQRAELELHPAELGRLDITLELDGQSVRAEFGSSHAEVRAAIESQLPRLRDLLAAQGFQLSDAQVGSQQRDSRSMVFQPPSTREDKSLVGEADSSTTNVLHAARKAAGRLDEFA